MRRQRNRISVAVWGLAAGVYLMTTAGPLYASRIVPEKLRPLAKDILGVLQEENQEAVAISEFPPDPFSGSNSGPGIRQALIDELQALAKRKDIVRDRANLVVRGTYASVDIKDNLRRELLVVQIEIVVVNRQGKQLLKRPAVIDSSEDIARLLSYTGDLRPHANKEDLNQHIKKGVDKRQVHIDGSKIQSSKDQPYAIELLVKGEYDREATPRTSVPKDGQAFVDIQSGELYEIRIHNLSALEAAVAVQIDGLDVFTFTEERDPKTDRSRFTHFVIAPGQHTDISGWHKTNDPKRKDSVLSFLVTEYGKGAASSRKATGKVGVITVTFAASWVGDNKPADEGVARNAGGNETGFGPPRQVGFRPVQRTIGVVRDQVSVRYAR